jgi:hypothetical protein
MLLDNLHKPRLIQMYELLQCQQLLAKLLRLRLQLLPVLLR